MCREVRSYFLKLASTWAKQELDWNERLAQMKEGDPHKQELWNVYLKKSLPDDLGEQIWNLQMQPDQSTRKYNELIVEKLGELLPFLITGSADVSSCDFTWLLNSGIVAKNDWDHQQIKFGVREFCMAACAYGMNLHGMIQPVVGTFRRSPTICATPFAWRR